MKMHQLFGGFDGMSVKKNKRLKYLDGWCGKMEIGSQLSSMSDCGVNMLADECVISSQWDYLYRHLNKHYMGTLLMSGYTKNCEMCLILIVIIPVTHE